MKCGGILSLEQILGHSDIHTTMMYAHLSPSYFEEEINRLDFGGIIYELRQKCF